jgi:hypothetical protein
MYAPVRVSRVPPEPGLSFAKNVPVRNSLIFRENYRIHAAIILYLFRFVRLLGSGHQAVAIENLALRRRLIAFKRKRKRPVLTQLDRLF